MRIWIDIDEAQLRSIDRLASLDKRSRASMVREAIAEYLVRRVPHALDNAYGLWSELKTDGLDYQEQVRREW